MFSVKSNLFQGSYLSSLIPATSLLRYCRCTWSPLSTCYLPSSYSSPCPLPPSLLTRRLSGSTPPASWILPPPSTYFHRLTVRPFSLLLHQDTICLAHTLTSLSPSSMPAILSPAPSCALPSSDLPDSTLTLTTR